MQSTNHIQVRRKSTQRGMATLGVSMLLLLGVTMVVMFTANSMVIEQKVSANDYRGRQAFEAAEAGVEHVLSLVDDLGRGRLSDTDADGDGKGEVSIDMDGDGTPDMTVFTGTFNTTGASGGAYSVTLETSTVGQMDTVRVTSTGNDSEAAAERITSSSFKWAALLANAPPAPLIARTSVILSGNVTISNAINPLTIWSGGSSALAGSAKTNPVVGTGSDSSGNGPDVVDNDGAMSALTGDEFFENFFQSTRIEVKEKCLVYTGAGNYSDALNGISGEALWIDGQGGLLKFNANTTIGTASNPVILIAENFSSIEVSGTLTIYGLVYVAGDWNNTGGGNMTVYGAAISEGLVSGNGTPNINFNPGVLGELNDLGSYAKVPGSWRDF